MRRSATQHPDTRQEGNNPVQSVYYRDNASALHRLSVLLQGQRNKLSTISPQIEVDVLGQELAYILVLLSVVLG